MKPNILVNRKMVSQLSFKSNCELCYVLNGGSYFKAVDIVFKM